MRGLLLALCAGCASYRLLPLPAEPGPMPVRYEKTRLFFRSVEQDGALARVFAGPSAILATVASPQSGVFASTDGGASWAFSPAPAFDAVLFSPRVIYVIAEGRVLHSDDDGNSFQGAPTDDPIEALTLGPEGILYAVGRGRLHVSPDGGRTFRTLAPRVPVKDFRARSMVALPGAILVSVRGQPAEPQRPSDRFAALLAYTSGEAVSALALVDSRETKPGSIRWGSQGDGVYLSRDGGASFAPSGLMVDSWLAVHDGKLYAVAADPLLQAAALMRRNPDLASAAEQHLQGERASGVTLRAACAFPGRDRLLAGPIAAAPIFRSGDGGATWVREIEPPLPLVLALREEVERQSWEAPAAPVNRDRRAPRPTAAPARRRGPVPAQSGDAGARSKRTASAETMLSFVDPARLLAHYNSGLQLSGVSGAYAYAPTREYWDALVGAMAAESEAEGEISLGPGLPYFPQGAAFDLLRSEDRRSWSPISAQPPPAPRGIVGYPESIAGAQGQVFLVLAGRSRGGESWRGGWRVAAP